MKQSCMSGSFASKVFESHETRAPVKVALTACRTRAACAAAEPRAEATYMEAKEQKSHTAVTFSIDRRSRLMEA